VASLESIQQSIDVTPEEELVEVEQKSDDEVIVNIDTAPMSEKFSG
jgi:hypothetical protein